MIKKEPAKQGRANYRLKLLILQWATQCLLYNAKYCGNRSWRVIFLDIQCMPLKSTHWTIWDFFSSSLHQCIWKHSKLGSGLMICDQKSNISISTINKAEKCHQGLSLRLDFLIAPKDCLDILLPVFKHKLYSNLRMALRKSLCSVNVTDTLNTA